MFCLFYSSNNTGDLEIITIISVTLPSMYIMSRTQMYLTFFETFMIKNNVFTQNNLKLDYFLLQFIAKSNNV